MARVKSYFLHHYLNVFGPLSAERLAGYATEGWTVWTAYSRDGYFFYDFCKLVYE
jgi:hypothetical protein